jgi:hypothetical protein
LMQQHLESASSPDHHHQGVADELGGHRGQM